MKMNFVITPKDKKLLKSSTVRKYIKAVDKAVNSKFSKKFWKDYHIAIIMGMPFKVFIPDKAKDKIKIEVFKDIYEK